MQNIAYDLKTKYSWESELIEKYVFSAKSKCRLCGSDFEVRKKLLSFIVKCKYTKRGHISLRKQKSLYYLIMTMIS